MPFTADSPLVTDVVLSPNHEPRRAAIDMLLLHYTGMESTDEALQRLASPEAKVSSHYLVRQNGAVVQLVPEARRAYHAGVSSWDGETDINSRSIGIEIANPGHDFGCPPYPEEQVAAVVGLCRDILTRHAIRAERVLAHSDVAPARKRDPGEWFFWRELAEAGIGLWVPPHPAMPGRGLAPGDSGEAVLALQQSLARYGYDLVPTGTFDAKTRDVVAAFQRHFRPARVDGLADPSTLATLDDLTAARTARAS
ncbi:N-acetylmuramoyl-L-alanine amidase [Xanthobacteraceae bacterium Astr-EGSB]|uniref:N-acetylmuramoyl-L-alanine amidase n=1 Tax=Astrobacterium formosum TaxID=3069710 RepID=UPI0027B7A415|nr:N-acetylmuramoyl-L-alanine amidase [Xanthobacteraceae bacterium Astr-EGSB]